MYPFSQIRPTRVHERAHLHGAEPRVWPARREIDRTLEALAIDQQVAAEVLLGLWERPIGDHRDAVLSADPLGVRRIGQSLGADQLPPIPSTATVPWLIHWVCPPSIASVGTVTEAYRASGTRLPDWVSSRTRPSYASQNGYSRIEATTPAVDHPALMDAATFRRAAGAVA